MLLNWKELMERSVWNVSWSSNASKKKSTNFQLSEWHWTLYSDSRRLSFSLFEFGAIISQRQQWVERVIAYANKTLSKSNETTLQQSEQFSQ